MATSSTASPFRGSPAGGGRHQRTSGPRPHAVRPVRTGVSDLRHRARPVSEEATALPVEEGAHLAAQLPHLLRGVFYEDWRPADAPKAYRSRDEALRRMADAAKLSGPTEASLALDACGRVLRRHVSEGEVHDVMENLPEALRQTMAA